MLATWRKRDLKSNEAGLKYYLMGVRLSNHAVWDVINWSHWKHNT